jgi:hypothetical protein
VRRTGTADRDAAREVLPVRRPVRCGGRTTVQSNPLSRTASSIRARSVYTQRSAVFTAGPMMYRIAFVGGNGALAKGIRP